MSEHAHLTQTKYVERGRVEVVTVVRRQHVETEAEIYRSMGYDVTTRYCGDPQCLGPEPPSRLMGERV